MLWPARSDDGGRDGRVPDHPGARERGRVAALAQPLDPAVDALVLEVSVRPRTHGHARALGVRLVLSVLACQPAAGERAEGLVVETALGAEGEDLRLVR